MFKPPVKFNELAELFDRYFSRPIHKDAAMDRAEEQRHRREIQTYLRRRGVRVRDGRPRLDDRQDHQRQ